MPTFFDSTADAAEASEALRARYSLCDVPDDRACVAKGTESGGELSAVEGRHHVKADEFKTVGDFAEYDCDAWRHLDEGRGRCEFKRVGPDLTVFVG